MNSRLSEQSINIFFEGFSWKKSTEYSQYATNLFFDDLETESAQKFQESNFDRPIRVFL